MSGERERDTVARDEADAALQLAALRASAPRPAARRGPTTDEFWDEVQAAAEKAYRG